jgi:radical SAM superfamily enzyme YgiQ (UPF0313 family)
LLDTALERLTEPTHAVAGDSEPSSLKQPHKLFFADLNYITPGNEWSIVPLPLGVAYIASFVRNLLEPDLDITLFKDPTKFLTAVTTKPPDIVAFSNYIWNRNLQLQFAAYIKKLHPGCITVMGGPNYNFAERAWVEAFLRDHPQIDFHIADEGEVKFCNLLACCVEHDFDLAAVRAAAPAGAIYVDPTVSTLIMDGLHPSSDAWLRDLNIDLDPKTGRLRDLNDIPSPYLTGLLDEFLADPTFCPIIETNRGCPYSCTFCNWGELGKSKSSLFSTDRVVDELSYIASHNVFNTPYLYICDANFGLFKRDVEIAQIIAELKEIHAFPQNVYLYFAKNSSDRVVRIAEILKDMTSISLSRQTQNEDVLRNIKRSNISLETFSSLAALAKSLGVDSVVELIYTLPGETKESFYGGVREILEQGVDRLHMFPAMLYEGSEMNTRASREHFGLKGEWRFIDGCAASYGPVMAMEFEEIITESDAMSRADHMEIRLFHFLETVFLSTKLYKDTEVLLGKLALLDLMLDLIANYATAPAPFRDLVDDFKQDAENEFLPEPPRAFTQDEVLAKQESSVKLNALYLAKLLYDPGIREAFHDFLTARICAIGATTPEQVACVVKYIDSRIFPFDETLERRVWMPFDAFAFAARPLGRTTDVADFVLDGPHEFRYEKRFSYGDVMSTMDPSWPRSKQVYEVLVHHTGETFKSTLTYQIGSPGVEVDRRIIRNDEGWLY